MELSDKNKLYELLKENLSIVIDDRYVPFGNTKEVHVRLMWNKQKLVGDNTYIDDWVEISSDFAEFHVRH